MKVLITGNDTFLANRLISRLSSENDRLYYIGNINPNPQRHLKTFSFSPSSDEIKEIFKTYRPDLAIYISNVKKECHKDLSSIQVADHVKGFFNIYSLADEYHVGRFIYVSSEYLYGKNIATADENSLVETDSMFTEAHYICEQHIINSRGRVFQKTLTLRVSTLFDEDFEDEKNIINCCLQYKNDFGSQDSVSDFQNKYDLLHSDDFVSAIIKFKNFDTDDMLNLGSGKQISSASLDKIVSESADGRMVDFNDIEISEGMNVDKAKNVYGFSSKRDIPSAIAQSTKAGRRHNFDNDAKKSLLISIKQFFKSAFFKSTTFGTIVAYLENIILFAILLIITGLLNKSLTNSFIDLRIAYIAAMGLIYGMKQSSLAAVLCIGLVIVNYQMNDYGMITIIYDIDVLIMILVFVSVAMFTGYLKDSNTRKTEELKEESLRLSEQLKYIREMYNESISVKETLQHQVLNTTDSYGRIFSSVEKLDSMHFDKLKTEIIVVAQEIMRNESIALYMVGKNTRFLRMLSYSAKLSDMPKSIEIEKSSEFMSVYENKTMYVKRSLSNTEAPLMIAPVILDGKVIAMLALYDAPLEILNLSYENLFRIASRLVSQAIIRAYIFGAAQESKWYIGETQVLTPESFAEKLAHAQQAYEKEQSGYVLLCAHRESHDVLIRDAEKYIREFDYVGKGHDEEIYILLNDISQRDIKPVMARLKKSKINTSVVKEAYNL